MLIAGFDELGSLRAWELGSWGAIELGSLELMFYMLVGKLNVITKFSIFK